MLDKERWMANERKLYGAAYGLSLRFLDVVKEMESRGWRPLIMEVRRTWARHLILYARRVTRTFRSKHLSGKAMDVIDARWEWKDTPVEFMVDLALVARKYGFSTGLLWDVPQHLRGVREFYLVRGDREMLIGLIKKHRGWDPCHLEAA